jgi:hypothetical protein
MGASTPVEFELQDSTEWVALRDLAANTYAELEPYKEKIALTYIDNDPLKQETTMVHHIIIIIIIY